MPRVAAPPSPRRRKSRRIANRHTARNDSPVSLTNRSKPPPLLILCLADDISSFPDPPLVANTVIGFCSAVYFARKACLAGVHFDFSLLDSFLANFLEKIKFASDSRSRATLAALNSIAGIPKSHITIYTDGSARPNPGPAGAGAYIIPPHSPPKFLFFPLGHGTNNIGELWAIGMAIDYISSSPALKSKNITICSDSNLAIGLVAKGWSSKTNQSLVLLIRKKIREFSNLVSFIWTPGHEDIPGNEIANRLANIGSSHSKKFNMPPASPCNGILGFRFTGKIKL